jgi:hypothetical protein
MEEGVKIRKLGRMIKMKKRKEKKEYIGRMNEGIENISKVQNPLDNFKELIDIIIENNTNYQQ